MTRIWLIPADKGGESSNQLSVFSDRQSDFANN